MQFTSAEAETLQRILCWRRDVRHFTAAPIAPDVLARLRRAMALAPSVGNARPWRVIQVERPALRAAVRANFAACNTDAATTYSGEKQAEYVRLKLAGLDIAPLQLAIFTVREPPEGHGLGRRTLPATLDQSTAMAIHTLWLVARAENIGLGMVSILDGDAMVRLFEVPADWVFSAYLCLGHAAYADDTPLLERVGWQKRVEHDWDER